MKAASDTRARCTLLVAVVTSCVVLAIVEAAGDSRLPGPASLPTPRQAHNRVLIATTIRDFDAPGRIDSLSRQLDHFAAACEAGFEVHVVLISRSQDWSLAGEVFAPTRNLCARMQADIPIAWSIHNHSLAAQHRRLFVSKLGTYDLYLSHEYDVLIKAHHLHYFKEWSRILQPMPLLHPGFFLYEVPTDHVNTTDLLQYAPALSLQDWRADMHIIKWRLHLLAMFHAGYDAAYMLTNAQLQRYSAQPAWLGSIGLPWDDYNAFFQGQWLSKHVHRVVPVAHLHRAMIHRSSNAHVNQAITATTEHTKRNRSSHLIGKRRHGIDVMEMMTVVRHCTGLALETPLLLPAFGHWSMDIKFFQPNKLVQSVPDPCAICLNAREAAVLLFSARSLASTAFSSDYASQDVPDVSAFDVEVSCSPELAQQWALQCEKAREAACVSEQPKYWGPVLGNTTKLGLIQPDPPA